MAPAVATGEMAMGSEMKCGQDPGPEQAEAGPEHTPDQTEDRRLDQELAADDPRSGPEGLAQSDLTDALGHRHQHDVHHADAPDQQRDAGDAPEQDGEGLVHRGGRAHQ